MERHIFGAIGELPKFHGSSENMPFHGMSAHAWRLLEREIWKCSNGLMKMAVLGINGLVQKLPKMGIWKC